jgi:uncharacterized membrane protein
LFRFSSLLKHKYSKYSLMIWISLVSVFISNFINLSLLSFD